MKVAIYARHSSQLQENSTTDQINRCVKWCQEQGHIIANTFYDEAKSGSAIINRQGIHKLIDAALHGEFEKIICEDLSRLSRDQGDIANFYKKMTFLDCSP